MIDRETEFGQRAVRRLRDETVIWLTTVTPGGTPQPAPVWFLFYDEPGRERLLVYSLNTAKRNANLRANPRVALNFNSNADGDDIVILTGRARIAPELPAPADNPAYIERYAERIDREWGSPEKYGQEYGLPLEITDLRLRGW